MYRSSRMKCLTRSFLEKAEEESMCSTVEESICSLAICSLYVCYMYI